MISERGRRLSSHDPFLVDAHLRCADNDFHPESNPRGYVNLGTAENRMVFDLLEPLLNRAQEICEPDTHYNVLHGARFFRDAIVRLLSNRAGRPLDAENLAVASGASAILENLAFVLCDPGEAILIPSPYYSGFDHDLALRSEALLRHIPLAGPDFMLAVGDITQAYERAISEGSRLKAILLNSPQNPLGQVYSRALIEDILSFAEKQKLHVIVDEIYAESLMPGVSHFSALGIKSDLVHVVYGFAKDFGLSGYKVGLLYSENREVIKAVQDSTYFYPVSMQTQRTLANFLEDEDLSAFLHLSRERLAAAYRETCAELTAGEIPFLPVEGGIVMWLDLRAFLRQPSFEAERGFFKHLFEHHRVSISPGKVFHSGEPGWFRLCFTVPESHRREALKRLVTGTKNPVVL